MIIKTTQRRVAITDQLIFFNQLKPEERSVLSRVNCRDIFSIMSTCKLTLWQIYYGGRFLTRRDLLTKLNKNILFLKKCATFRSIKTNVHKNNFIHRPFSNITFQTLVFRQRDKTRLLLNSIYKRSPRQCMDPLLCTLGQSVSKPRWYRGEWSP